MPPAGWPVPPRPQPWFPPNQAVSIPSPSPVGVVQQPLFPVQNVRPPMLSTSSPAFQPSLPIAPPGLPQSTPSAPVSQPLFPVLANNNLPTHSSPFSAPMLSTSIPFSSRAELKNSFDPHVSNNSSVASSYNSPTFPGLIPHLIVNLC